MNKNKNEAKHKICEMNLWKLKKLKFSDNSTVDMENQKQHHQ